MACALTSAKRFLLGANKNSLATIEKPDESALDAALSIHS